MVRRISEKGSHCIVCARVAVLSKAEEQVTHERISLGPKSHCLTGHNQRMYGQCRHIETFYTIEWVLKCTLTRNGVRRPSYECSDRGIVGAAAPAAFDDVIEGGEFPEIRL